MKIGAVKYLIILINIFLFSNAELETRSKMMALSCSKLIAQKYKEKPESEIFSKTMLSCFIKISQTQAQKIYDNEGKDSFPLKPEEIEKLLNINNLKELSEEEINSQSALMNNYIKEIGSPNLRKLVELDNDDKEAPKDNIDNTEIKDDETKDDDDNDDELNDFEYDPNYYGDDMNDGEDMYNGRYDDYYDDYDDYYGYGNYNDYDNMSDDYYSNMYGNDQPYYDDDNKPFKVLLKENQGLAIFIGCLVIMIILIAIFGKDFEETQTLEIDPNKNKNE